MRPGGGARGRRLAASLAAVVSLAGVALLRADAPPAPQPRALAVVEPRILRLPPPDAIRLSWGPTQGDFARGLRTAHAMTLDEAAGQVIVAKFGGREPKPIEKLVRRYHLGGVAFGGGNVGPAWLNHMLTAAAQAGADGRDWPVIVATDQEGGTVARLHDTLPDMPTFLAAGATRDKAVVERAFLGTGADMRAAGFNVDFAPVADLTAGLADPIIRSRSPGDDADDAAATVVAAADGLLGSGVLPVVKHFPGHGSVTVDSHLGLPVQKATIEDLAGHDLVPFQAAIDAGVPMVMMSHVAVKAWGGQPASLDPEAYDYLRNVLGFRGVIITDSLSMAAVAGRGEGGPAVAALNAGADLVLMPSNTGAAHDQIVAAVESGLLSRARLDDAVARSITLMRWEAGLPAGDADGDYVRDLDEQAIVVTSPRCGGPLVGRTVTLSGGWADERAALAAALAKHGIAVGASGTSVRLLGSAGGAGDADVVVALDGPWGLPASHATTYIGLFGRSPTSFAALADVLAGSVEPTGRWPVRLRGLSGTECGPP